MFTQHILVNPPVYPSKVRSVAVAHDDTYHGAHRYRLLESSGFKDGQAQYVATVQDLHFVQKDQDGTMQPGIQSEQLLIVLLDRHRKLNAAFPSEQHDQFEAGIQMALDALAERVRERMARGVMGELKQ